MWGGGSREPPDPPLDPLLQFLLGWIVLRRYVATACMCKTIFKNSFHLHIKFKINLF